jgi:hypothetical protein
MAKVSRRFSETVAGDGFKEDQVKKAATEVLELAGWPPKVKPPKTPKVV